MSDTTETTDARTDRTSPLYAAVGVTDFLIERLRNTSLERDTERLQHLFEARVQQGVAEVKAFPERAQAAAADAIDSASAVYTDLAARGELLVTRIRSQKSTQAARAQATATADSAEATTDSARVTTESARTTAESARTTAESARATAETTAGAAAEAAEKVGD